MSIADADQQVRELVEQALEVRQRKISEAVELSKSAWSNVAPALAALKRHTGTTDAEIAEALNLSRQTVQNRLSGTTAIAPWELEGFAAFFDVPADVLFGGAEDAIRWVLDHPSRVRLRNRYFALGEYGEPLSVGA